MIDLNAKKSLESEAFETSISISHTNIDSDVTMMQNTLAETIKKYRDTSDNDWVQINDPAMTAFIINTYGDQLNRKILQSVTGTARRIMEISSVCGIPQTTGYRKILRLIKDQFLIPYDKVGGENHRGDRYISAIKSIQIQIRGNKDITIRARFSRPGYAQDQDFKTD